MEMPRKRASWVAAARGSADPASGSQSNNRSRMHYVADSFRALAYWLSDYFHIKFVWTKREGATKLTYNFVSVLPRRGSGTKDPLSQQKQSEARTMINLYREVYEDPKQRQFPIRSAAEAPWHAPIDPPLPPAFLELAPPHFAASDPHSRLMLEGAYSGTAIEVSAAKQSRYCDNPHDEKHPGLIFVPVVCSSSHLLTRELRNSQKICEGSARNMPVSSQNARSHRLFLGELQHLSGEEQIEEHISEERAADSSERESSYRRPDDPANTFRED
jgi:hypothetical protein